MKALCQQKLAYAKANAAGKGHNQTASTGLQKVTNDGRHNDGKRYQGSTLTASSRLASKNGKPVSTITWAEKKQAKEINMDQGALIDSFWNDFMGDILSPGPAVAAAASPASSLSPSNNPHSMLDNDTYFLNGAGLNPYDPMFMNPAVSVLGAGFYNHAKKHLIQYGHDILAPDAIANALNQKFSFKKKQI